MLPLFVLLFSFFIAWSINRYFMNQRISLSFLGRLSMSIMLVLTGLSHFFKNEVMVQAMPDVVPFKEEVVFFTGILELIFAVGLLLPKYYKFTSFMLVVFFLCVLPANIIGSFKRVSLGGMENGPLYLWFRIPLQLFFMGWVYYFGVAGKNISGTSKVDRSATSNIRETE